MIEVNDQIAIAESEIQLDFIRASGPGGQNVNKVSTAVQLRYDVDNASLPEDVRGRLKHIARSRITKDGVLIIDAGEHRTQEQNRQAALDRLVELIRRAAVRPKLRQHTQPSAAARRQRLEDKRRQGQKKQLRRLPRRDETE